jgi:hypothetical protein
LTPTTNAPNRSNGAKTADELLGKIKRKLINNTRHKLRPTLCNRLDGMKKFLDVGFRIEINTLLRSRGPTMPLADLLALKKTLELAEESPGDGAANLISVGDDELKQIGSRYGEEGLFRLCLLAMKSDRREFAYFHQISYPWWEDIRKTEKPLTYDNAQLSACRDLERFASNLLQPSLSRKLYVPGRSLGYVVYGLGGPRILVSHAFRGASAVGYDFYSDSLDLVTSLIARGYGGTFLLLDYLPGLNYEIHGLPAWLLWFSKISVHSDLVLFVTEGQDGLSNSQVQESEYTPDWVRKNIVQFPKGELSWAIEQPSDHMDLDPIVILEGRKLTWEEYLEYERKNSRDFVQDYLRVHTPEHGIIRMDEDGEIVQYPGNWPMYQDL